MTGLVVLFLQGWLIGFSIAMPVGPVAMLCIRHALIRGTLYGIVAGFGAAAADTVYGVIGGLGITMICDFLVSYQLHCQLLGALFLCYMGISTLRAPPKEKSEDEIVPMRFIRVFLSGFVLTLTNPLTLVGFIGIYAALGLGFAHEKILAFITVMGGIFVGSVCWWFILSIASTIIGRKINFQSTRLLNRISGTGFLAFGIIVAISAFLTQV